MNTQIGTDCATNDTKSKLLKKFDFIKRLFTQII